MYTVLSTLFCIAGWITALIVNVVWHKHCDKMNNEWYERCLSINETWADLCMELIGDETDHKDEPQTAKVIGCSKCSDRFWCTDRDMPHAVHCNNYGKSKDEQSGKE